MQQKSRCLALVAVPTETERRIATSRLSELGVRLLGMLGHGGLVVEADERGIQAMRRSSAFRGVYRGHVSRATRDALSGQAIAIDRWNRLVDRRRGQDSPSSGYVPWNSPDAPACGGVLTLDHESVVNLIRHGLDELQDVEKIRVFEEAMLLPVDPLPRIAARREFERTLIDAWGDETLAHNVVRSALQLPPVCWPLLPQLPVQPIAIAFESLLLLNCWRLQGDNLIDIVFVENTALPGDEFTPEEREAVVADIAAGLLSLASSAPSGAQLSFSYPTDKLVTVTLEPQEDSNPPYWLNTAVGTLTRPDGSNYPASRQGLLEYQQDLATDTLPAHVAVIFITRDQEKFAGRAFIGRWDADDTYRAPFVQMAKNQGDWTTYHGRSRLAGIAIHEILHLFGAPDEYGENEAGTGTPCYSCTTLHGCWSLPNGNCVACATLARPCIMAGSEPYVDTNGLSLCSYTQGHIGWSDLFLEIKTHTLPDSGTTDALWLDIGERQFQLLNTNWQALGLTHTSIRQPGRIDGYALNYSAVEKDDVKRVMLRKPFGIDNYRLAGLRLWVRGEPVCLYYDVGLLDEQAEIFLAPGCGTADQSPDGGIPNPPIGIIKVFVTTADEFGAGTDDDVYFRLGTMNWVLLPKSWPSIKFAQGQTDQFLVYPETGMTMDMVNRVSIRKDAAAWWDPANIGAWKLAGLTVEVDGDVIYANPSIDQWLDGKDPNNWQDRIFEDYLY
jgi:hypothetical protein